MTIEANNRKITANRYVLNYISLLANEAAQNMDRKGCHAIAEEARKFAQEIYDIIDATGFYKD